MNLVEHAEYELKNAGYTIREIKNIETDDDYSDAIANSVLEMIKIFAEQGHSGLSAGFAIGMFNKLVNFENLTPLTNNPDEWIDRSVESGEQVWQSKRNSACFTKDMKTYYNINDEDNKEYHYEDGEKTGWYCIKADKDLKYEELQLV